MIHEQIYKLHCDGMSLKEIKAIAGIPITEASVIINDQHNKMVNRIAQIKIGSSDIVPDWVFQDEKVLYSPNLGFTIGDCICDGNSIVGLRVV